MKRLTSRIMLLALSTAAVIGLNSCLNDNNDDDIQTYYHQITNSEKADIINKAAGNYSGMLHFFTTTMAVSSDSTGISWVIRNDSTAEITMPVSFLSRYVTDTSDQSSVSATTGTVTVVCNLSMPNYLLTTYYDAGYYEMGLLPDDNTQRFITNDNKLCTLNFSSNQAYTVNNTAYYPTLTYHNSQSFGCLLLETLQVGSNTYRIGLPVAFSGNKS